MNDRELGRLRWQCRRGMLELDLIFTDFLDHRYAALDEPARRTFRRLLEQPDTLLLRWLHGDGRPDDAELAEFIQTCLHAAHH